MINIKGQMQLFLPNLVKAPKQPAYSFKTVHWIFCCAQTQTRLKLTVLPLLPPDFLAASFLYLKAMSWGDGLRDRTFKIQDYSKVISSELVAINDTFAHTRELNLTGVRITPKDIHTAISLAEVLIDQVPGLEKGKKPLCGQAHL